MRSKNGRGIRTDFALDARDDGIEFLRNGMAGLLESQQFTGDFGVFDLPEGCRCRASSRRKACATETPGEMGTPFFMGILYLSETGRANETMRCGRK